MWPNGRNHASAGKDSRRDKRMLSRFDVRPVYTRSKKITREKNADVLIVDTAGRLHNKKYLMDELNIPCTLVIGTATNSQGQTENHAWNYVYLNNNWYAVDVTWDDPIIIGGGQLSSKEKYRYFLKGENSFNANHTSTGYFTDGGQLFTYPKLSLEDYK